VQVQDRAVLQAEPAQAQQEKAKQEEQRQQLHWKLRKLQEAQGQSQQEASVSQAFPQSAGSLPAQHWQQLQQDSERALALREEELLLCKAELASLKEELSEAMEQVQ
ncbi:hypothetical protein N331_09491, partial [Merops nubicus]